jgi:hypothetical protein
MLNSNYRRLCEVELPYQNRQKYMHTFDLANPVMAKGFEDYLLPVTRLCKAAGALAGIAHMTVDEKLVLAGKSQRKPKPHVDGCFIPLQNSWGHSGWAHGCNHVETEKIGRMPVIVAASVAGCRAWRGLFDAEPTNVGDLSHILDQLGPGELLPANVGYLLSPDGIHESLIFDHDTKRSFLRIALPVDFRG